MISLMSQMEVVYNPIFLEAFFFMLSALFAMLLARLFELNDFISVMGVHVVILFLFLLLRIIDPMFYVMLIIELLIIMYSLKDRGSMSQ